MSEILDAKWMLEVAERAIRERVAAGVPPDVLCRLAERAVARLTLAQVQRVLGKRTRAATVAWLKKQRVPVVRYSRQDIYVLASDLAAVDAAHKTRLDAERTEIGKAVQP